MFQFHCLLTWAGGYLAELAGQPVNMVEQPNRSLPNLVTNYSYHDVDMRLCGNPKFEPLRWENSEECQIIVAELKLGREKSFEFLLGK